MNLWLWIGLALVVGGIVGAVAATLLARRSRGDQDSAKRVRAELEEYRLEVKEHFVQTAELVNNLTRSYKAVYDHLESGAYGLVGDEALRKELGDVEEEPIKLEYIGTRGPVALVGSSDTGVGEDPSPEIGNEERAAVDDEDAGVREEPDTVR